MYSREVFRKDLDFLFYSSFFIEPPKEEIIWTCPPLQPPSPTSHPNYSSNVNYVMSLFIYDVVCESNDESAFSTLSIIS